MVRTHNGRLMAELPVWAEELFTDNRVLPHNLPLIVAERTSLMEAVVADADLADVVYPCRKLDAFDLIVLETMHFGNASGQGCNPVGVLGRVRVTGVNGVSHGNHGLLGLGLQTLNGFERQVGCDGRHKEQGCNDW